MEDYELNQLIVDKKKELKELQKKKWVNRRDKLPHLIKKIRERYDSQEILEWVETWGTLNYYIHSCIKRSWNMTIISKDKTKILRYSYVNGESQLIFTTYKDYIWNFLDANIFGTADIADQIKWQIGLGKLPLHVFIALVKDIICCMALKFGAHVDKVFSIKCECPHC